jgi:hypothetical protein
MMKVGTMVMVSTRDVHHYTYTLGAETVAPVEWRAAERPAPDHQTKLPGNHAGLFAFVPRASSPCIGGNPNFPTDRRTYPKVDFTRDFGESAGVRTLDLLIKSLKALLF